MGVVDEDVESANEALELSMLLFQAVWLGVDGYEGLEQLEGGPEPELGLGLLLLDRGEKRASFRRPLLWSSNWRCLQISSGSCWYSSFSSFSNWAWSWKRTNGETFQVKVKLSSSSSVWSWAPFGWAVVLFVARACRCVGVYSFEWMKSQHFSVFLTIGYSSSMSCSTSRCLTISFSCRLACASSSLRVKVMTIAKKKFRTKQVVASVNNFCFY